MTALTSGRNTPERAAHLFVRPVAAGAKIFEGGIVVLNANRFAEAGQPAAGLLAAGRAEGPADNTGGVDGAVTVEVKSGNFYYASAAGADLIGQADIGNACYVLDDQTVAKTDGGGARSKAGIILDIDPRFGVLVAIGLSHS